jgi:crotonobetainyl-CoA:carnitine CoA-transferase CaiB-like acyl-CoA transferase
VAGMMSEQEGALAGITVIDLSRVLGGPYCTQILGDHGADVLKIEPPQGDETRGWGQPVEGGEASAYFQGVNRNKRGAVLDLTDPDAREILLGLLEGADVLVENFKPGTMGAWGLGAAHLADRFPRLIHCRVSGFGADGPLGGLPGYDAAVQAMVGLLSVNGEAGGAPLRLGVPVVDLATGLNAVIGILLALQERTRSGRGQFVDVALFDCGVSMLHPHSANFLMSGLVPEQSGNDHPNITPYGVFRTGAGEIFLAVGNDRQFRKLCEMLEAPTLAQEARYLTNNDRTRQRAELAGELERLLARFEAESLADKLIRGGVPCSPILSVPQALALAHTAHRELVVRKDGYAAVGAPIKLSRTPASYRRLPPKFGEHNGEIMLISSKREDAQ